MAGVEQNAPVEEDRNGEPTPTVRIDTDVFAALTETTDRDGSSTFVRWFDCWRS